MMFLHDAPPPGTLHPSETSQLAPSRRSQSLRPSKDPGHRWAGCHSLQSSWHSTQAVGFHVHVLNSFTFRSKQHVGFTVRGSPITLTQLPCRSI